MLARDPTTAPCTQPEPPARRLAAFDDYDGLIAALRDRVDELQITRSLLDELSGLPTGLSGKIFGLGRAKRIGMDSLWMLLPALGVRLTLEEDHNSIAQMSGRWERRHEEHRRTGIIRRSITPELLSAVAREMGRRGAQARRRRRTGRRS